jgi:hypothetical protein
LAVELGCWLGACTAAIGEGLASAGYAPRPLHCYDRWLANAGEAEKANARGLNVSEGDDTTPLFLSHVMPVYPHIETHRGEMDKAAWTGETIELFVLDAAKVDKPLLHVLRTFGPCWIPGVTTVALMDFNFDLYKTKEAARHRYGHQRRLVAAAGDALECVYDSPDDYGPAIFQYRHPLDFAKWLATE